MLIRQDRRGLGLVEHLQLRGHDLDLARRQPGVGIADALPHQPGDGNDVLAPERSGLGDHMLAHILQVEHDLHQPLPVAQVYEDQAFTLVSIGIDPPSQGDGLAVVVDPQFTTHVGALEH